MFKRATIVLQLHIHVCSPIFPLNVVPAKRHYRYHGVTMKFFFHRRGNYRGYRGITAFPITVSSSGLYHRMH